MKFSSPLREEDQNSARTGESTGHQSGFLEEQKEKEWGMEEMLRKGQWWTWWTTSTTGCDDYVTASDFGPGLPHSTYN